MTTTTQPTADDAGEEAFPTLEQLRAGRGNVGFLWNDAATDEKRGYVALIEENLRLRESLRVCFGIIWHSDTDEQCKARFLRSLIADGISPSPLVRSEADAKEGGAA